MIWAMDDQRLIGKNDTLPWYLPNDMKHFRTCTLGKTVVMGRKTYESLPHALPKRHNIVLTKQVNWQPHDAEIIHTVEDIQMIARNEEVIIIGGAQVYALFIPYAHKLLITKIAASFSGNKYFPQYDENKWKLISEVEGIIDTKNTYSHKFQTFIRKPI